jgi:heparanase 1
MMRRSQSLWYSPGLRLGCLSLGLQHSFPSRFANADDTKSGAWRVRHPKRGRFRVRDHIGATMRGCLVSVLLIASTRAENLADSPSVAPSKMARIGTVDERFQSYNIEMIEVAGGRFWKPYRSKPGAPPVQHPQSGLDPPGMDSNLYEYRPPTDLTNARLRKLAAALAPAYMRVSGTWANSTYFSDSDDAPAAPPAGFHGTLTRQQWRGVVEFSQSVDARIVISFAVSPGTRNAAGVWKPDQANRLLTYTRSIGGSIAAGEFMNEPNLAEMGAAPAGYDATAYGRDFRLFHAFMKQTTPETMILGPGTVGEPAIASDMLAASGPALDVVSYHYYGTLSERCSGKTAPEAALSEDWLSRTDRILTFYRTLRDRFEPGKPIWLTETADAACGGNPWAVSFLDTFRYLDQLGRLARAGVQVVMHNTLAASDYGLLDEGTLNPRPKYWGALLWRQLMGTTVLDPGVPLRSGLHVYAHCQRGTPGGVALLVINMDRHAPHALALPTASMRYGLNAASLMDTSVRLNGRPLRLSAGEELPTIEGRPTAAGTILFEQATITFLAVPAAGNDACR